MKRSIKDAITIWLSEYFLPYCLRLFGLTWRMTISNEEVMPDDGTIFTIWHGQLLVNAYAFRNRGIKVLISKSRDGELIARAIQRMGFGVVRGSSSRSGAKAVRKILELLENGEQIAFTPDGPRGPGYVVKDGVALVAQKSGTKVMCGIVTGAKPAIRLKSWDSFIIPLPFAKVKVEVRGPIAFSPTDDREFVRNKIEELMKTN